MPKIKVIVTVLVWNKVIEYNVQNDKGCYKIIKV